ncbi:hypothetical protein N7490_000607 [Penicillium lividum]|nr:hypothetical protein N7490_000607 [Penicillium lividum]
MPGRWLLDKEGTDSYDLTKIPVKLNSAGTTAMDTVYRKARTNLTYDDELGAIFLLIWRVLVVFICVR